MSKPNNLVLIICDKTVDQQMKKSNLIIKADGLPTHFNNMGTLGEAGFSSLTHPLPPLLFMVCSRSHRAKGRTVLYWCHGASQQPLLTVSAASGYGYDQEKI